MQAGTSTPLNSSLDHSIKSHYDSQDHSLPTLEAGFSAPANANDQISFPYGDRLASSHSRLHHLVSRAYIYVRGPRPKLELSDPEPILDIKRTIFGRHLDIPIESTFIQRTRTLTRPWIFCVLTVGYIIGLAFLSRANSYLTPADSYITCTDTYWGANNQCGLDGQQCGPWTNGSTFDFRCQAQCSDVILQNPRTIGNDEMAFEPLLVGGGDAARTYRGDSFICAAAIQAGMFSNSKGGCASLRIVTDFTGFTGTIANGLRSISFPTTFPIAFELLETTSLKSCTDLREAALAINTIVTCIIFLLLRPKPIVLFWSLVCIGFWHISLFSQPAGNPPPLSTIFQRFLPVLFISYAIWRLSFRFVLPGFLNKAPLEGCIWYLGPFWVTVLSNMSLEKIPVGRLTASDISQRKGGIVAFVIILVVLVGVVVNQVRVIRKTGWLLHYAKWYIAGGLVMLVIALLPSLQLRLHHYIIALALLPGTAFKTRLSAVYQGFLLGLFLNGTAAFGLDSILQTVAELRQDATLGSDLPIFLTNSSTWNASIPLVDQTITWLSPPEGWDGFSLLVDDVERLRGDALNFSLALLDATLPHFFRLALTSSGQAGDFTKAATLWPNGTWSDPLQGPSY